MMHGAGAWLRVNKRNAEHISSPSKRLHLGQAKFFHLLDRGSRVRCKAKSAKGCPAIAQFMLEADASAQAAAKRSCVVAPEI
jgi:hypothetical protein